MPAGRDAERIFQLWTVMAIGAGIIWAAIVGIAFYATRLRTGAHHPRLTHGLIIGGGAVFPVVTLSALLIWGLMALPAVLALPSPGGMTVSVTGHQWWWRVRYMMPDGRSFELANELQLPVGERIEVQLQSADVIHSFWLPSLAGKMDLIPGRLNRIALEPTSTGVFRGACAEYCGDSHAHMQFYAVVTDRARFDAWIQGQLNDAAMPATPLAQTGSLEFLGNGCGACHTVRGTPAAGRFGPDLTHLASRQSFGAGMFRVQVGQLQRWIQVTERVKPGVHMPSFNMIPPGDARAIATYLSELR